MTTPRFASSTPPAGDMDDGATNMPSVQRGAGRLTEPSAFTVSFTLGRTFRAVELDDDARWSFDNGDTSDTPVPHRSR